MIHSPAHSDTAFTVARFDTIRKHLGSTFADHTRPIRRRRAGGAAPDELAALLHAVAGMVPSDADDLDPGLDTIQGPVEVLDGSPSADPPPRGFVVGPTG